MQLLENIIVNMNTSVNKSSDFSEFCQKDLVFAKVRGLGQIESTNIEKESCKFTNYKVKFFATNQIGPVKKDICHYNDNKANYPPEYIALSQRNVYKRALTEVDSVWRLLGYWIQLVVPCHQKTSRLPLLINLIPTTAQQPLFLLKLRGRFGK